MLTIVFYTTVILMCSISTLHCRAMWTMERNAILHLELISGGKHRKCVSTVLAHCNY